MAYYRRRLARIHVQDYTAYATAAAHLLAAEPTGSVLDVGCGGGDLHAGLPGWDYLGLDASPDMIALARSGFPAARFECGDAMALPSRPVNAIVAVGEVLNYATDLAGFIAWARQARRRLRPGGVLLLDLAGPTRADPQPQTRLTSTPTYQIEVTVQTDPQRQILTRKIVVHDDAGSETETHVLHLMDPLDVVAALRAAGFEVTSLDRYAPDLPFARGWSGFLGRVILDT